MQLALALTSVGVLTHSSFNASVQAATPRKPCVQIYFDRSSNPAAYWMGRTYALFTQNYLGHFPQWQQIVSAIELYQPGELDRCEANIYIGSYFENQIPQSFLDDFARTKSRVMWLGYSIWKYPSAKLGEMFGFEYDGLTTLDTRRLDASGAPSFFRDVLYKGEVFPKFGEYVKLDPTDWHSSAEFRAAFEQLRLRPATRPEDRIDVDVLAEVRHSATGEVIPYAIRKKNRFLIADIAMSYMHESDRSLVFADLLYDLLNEQPRHAKRPAVVRIEDVHPKSPLWDLEDIAQVLRDEKVPITISLIPIFFDPLERALRSRDEEFVPMNRDFAFMQWIRRLQSENATFIWHGVTHQRGRLPNPHNGLSGADFEFWDATTQTPLPEDSPAWLVDRLEEGWNTLQAAGISPQVWVTPHYQASSIDYAIFARVMPWNMGRVIYYNHRLRGQIAATHEADLRFDPRRPQNAQNRAKWFATLEADVEFERWNGQLFPWEIYGDVHGQRIIPENLGNSQPYISPHVVRTRSVQDIVRDARRNLVLRDAWASFFYHPFLIQTIESGGRGTYPGDPGELRWLIQEIKKLGYEFVDLDAWAKANDRPIRPEPLVRDFNFPLPSSQPVPLYRSGGSPPVRSGGLPPSLPGGSP